MSEEGYRIDPENIKPILRLKDVMPKTVLEIRQLADLLGYYQAKETPAGAVCNVICDLVSIDVATEQL